jgi:bifunctional non-homologous end joining protein LigD
MSWKALIKPMLAKPSAPFDSEDHIFELKWDGTRSIMFIDKGGVRLQNRRLRDITHRYPEFGAVRLGAGSAVLDGELVVLSGGRPDFKRLQQREHQEDPARIGIVSKLLPATYAAFDLLYLGGRSLLKKPLSERRRLLKGLFPIKENIILSESYSRGRGLFRLALKKGFEGVMAKEKTSPYLPGQRSGYWLKVKKSSDLDAVICGWLEGKGRAIGSLVLGLYDNGKLLHVGQVAAGLDAKTIGILHRMLSRLKGKCPFDEVPKLQRRAFWTRPEMVVRVGYQEWSERGRLRVPVFKGIRDDKPPGECVLLDERPRR